MALTTTIIAWAGIGLWPEDAPAQQTDESPARGVSSDALPGLFRVITPTPSSEPVLTTAAFGGYGYTESQPGDTGEHHRIDGSVAAAVAAFDYLSFGLDLEFRHDIHPEDEEGPDDGSVIDAGARLRGSYPLSPTSNLGLQLAALLPGGSSDSFASPLGEVLMGFNYTLPSRTLLALQVGYRMPVQGDVLDEAALLRPGDRLALGLSEFHALPFGLGARQSFGPTQVLAEVTWDLLAGDGAPDPLQSPLRVSAGARHRVTKSWALQMVIEANLGERAPAAPGESLVPVEPRLRALVGLSYAFDLSSPPQAIEAAREPAPQPTTPKPAPQDEPLATGDLRVEVVDETGHPISDARVRLVVSADADTGERDEIVLELSERNVYVAQGVPVGTHEVRIDADLLEPHTQEVEVVKGETSQLDVKLQPAGSVKAVLRGLVRSYSGDGLAATVTVEPGDKQVETNAEGVFELELPPGDYTVIIEAEGYRSQRRKLRVRNEGVTVLNADLQATGD